MVNYDVISLELKEKYCHIFDIIKDKIGQGLKTTDNREFMLKRRKDDFEKSLENNDDNVIEFITNIENLARHLNFYDYGMILDFINKYDYSYIKTSERVESEQYHILLGKADINFEGPFFNCRNMVWYLEIYETGENGERLKGPTISVGVVYYPDKEEMMETFNELGNTPDDDKNTYDDHYNLEKMQNHQFIVKNIDNVIRGNTTLKRSSIVLHSFASDIFGNEYWYTTPIGNMGNILENFVGEENIQNSDNDVKNRHNKNGTVCTSLSPNIQVTITPKLKEYWRNKETYKRGPSHKYDIEINELSNNSLQKIYSITVKDRDQDNIISINITDPDFGQELLVLVAKYGMRETARKIIEMGFGRDELNVLMGGSINHNRLHNKLHNKYKKQYLKLKNNKNLNK